MRLSLSFLTFMALVLAGAVFSQQSPQIVFNEDPADPSFELRGWSGAPDAGREEPSADQWRAVFAVFVDQGAGNEDVPPLSGSYRLHDGVLTFEPRYPLQPGLAYRAVFHSGRGDASSAETLTEIFAIPKEDEGPRTFVEEVYPTADRLPENQLKLYIHFSSAMSRGEAYRRVSLLDSAGHPIEFPFLELQQELWGPEGKRLTLLFDPGRVKRDLLPNREVGSPLREGESYTLVVDPAWPDADGRPLQAEFRKAFDVGPPDYEIPDEKNWQITLPRRASWQPLVVRFPEPMDHALLVHVIHITTPGGEKIAGTIEVSEQETRWEFTPDKPWKAGDYLIDAPTFLEDLAGNTLARPFEVDVFEKVEERVERVSRTVRFTVAP